MDAAVKKLFADYEKAFDALDIEKQVDFFADTFISAGPKGTIAQGRDQFMKMSRQAADYYRKLGQTGARILSMKETPISDQYSFVTVHWGATFRKTGDKPVEFDVTYVLMRVDPKKPRIIMFVTHQDEEETMKELGLMDEAAA